MIAMVNDYKVSEGYNIDVGEKDMDEAFGYEDMVREEMK